MKWTEPSERIIFIDNKTVAVERKKATFADMVEQYKDKSTDTAIYEIEGQTFIVTAHFVGEKNLDKVIYDHAFKRALEETKTA